MRVYLAGPDVFMPDPHERAAVLKALCTKHGLVGVSPLDALAHEPEAWAGLHEPYRIARRNEAHIASCAALVANLTPFRGPSADVGTVFELGYMRALGRPVYGWTNSHTSFTTRTRAFLNMDDDSGDIDDNGMQVENFGPLADNLMIDSAIAASGGVLIRHPNCPDDEHWTEFGAFELCLATLRSRPQRP